MNSADAKEMYFAVIEASPQLGTEAFDKYEGASICCWVNTTDFSEGRQRANLLIKNTGWFVKTLTEEKLIGPTGRDPANVGLEPFKQALIDGEVCVIFTRPHRRSAK